jgi:outer membrane protein OmpA-like peptidoglycan-associated protein
MPGRIGRYRFAAGVGCLALGLAGCALSGPSTAAGTAGSVSGVVLTAQIKAAALTIIVPGRSAAPMVSAIVGGTARPAESLLVMAAAGTGRVLITSLSLSPATVIVPGRPAAPSPGASPYQWALYRQKVRRWRAELAAGRAKVAKATTARVDRWVRDLRIGELVAGAPAAQGKAASLGAECDEAADVAPGFTRQAQVGGRRAVVLFVTSLAGTVPAGELSGDDVLVVTNYLPTVEDASAAQIELLRAGAARAVVVGPETPPAQISQQIEAGQTLMGRSEIFPGTVLFTRDSAALPPGARRSLQPLLALLRRPGSTAVVNGYASVPGSARRSDLLASERAAAVAEFLESAGIPASAITAVGHGTAGSLDRYRRVVVVVTGP